jgi:23S rRNA G2069 N7-methylase RlmK/C1962 C5-methylase RlmI
MFRNRLRKNLRRLAPWAKQRGLMAYRLYDSDIPEVRLIVERYDECLVVSEYVRRADVEDPVRSEAEHQRFLADVERVLCSECQVAPNSIYFKSRWRQRKGDNGQYGRLPSQQEMRLIREGPHRFFVNLSDYLDTGLFLDHRETRALVSRLAAGKRVLNLFGYTGSFSVYAAGGGALSSVTVDMSATYLQWAQKNFVENGLDLLRHRLVRADVLRLLRAPKEVQAELLRSGQPGAASAKKPLPLPEFDLIVLDPPTFSNSKRMQGTLDIERDHPWLIGQALGLLYQKPASGQPRAIADRPALLFSCNHRRFSLRAGEIAVPLQGPQSAGPPKLTIRDLSEETLPRDFHDPRTRCCFLIRIDS